MESNQARIVPIFIDFIEINPLLETCFSRAGKLNWDLVYFLGLLWTIDACLFILTFCLDREQISKTKFVQIFSHMRLQKLNS